MAPNALSALVAVTSASLVVAQATLTFPAVPLISQYFPVPADAPYQVFPATTPYVRGPQTGYNICNSTTETQDSQCQTSYFNDIDDFCLWGPPTPDSSIADTEGIEVAWCTQPGHGTRVIPQGTLLGAQLLKTPDYWMITGLIDQTQINMQANDTGGELDCGGQDERGNPIGGLMYGTAFNTSVYQINWWTEFIGSGMFCMKICNPESSNEPGYCQHTLDRIGLGYNCPSKYTVGGGYQPGEFEVCESADMGVPGIYVAADGTTSSYSQPPESLGAITTIPYQPTTVASSSCTTYTSSVLFASAPTASAVSSSKAATATGKSGVTTAKAGTGTGTGSPASETGSSGALANSVSMVALIAAGFGAFLMA
jgi:hypothetical protein